MNTTNKYAVVITDAMGKISNWSEEATELYGFDKRDMIGKSIISLLPVEEAGNNEQRENLKNASEYLCFRSISKRKKKSGELFTADIYYTAIFSDDNLLTGFTKTIREVKNEIAAAQLKEAIRLITPAITERLKYRMKPNDGQWALPDAGTDNLLQSKEAAAVNNTVNNITAQRQQEYLLIESEKKYKTLFTNNPLPLIFWDLETQNISDFNEAALTKYGYTRDEFLGLPIKSLWPNDDPSVLNKVLQDQNPDAPGSKVFKFKRYHKTRSGVLIYVEIFGQYVNIDEKRVAFAMVNDITEAHYYHDLERIEKELFELKTGNEKKLSDAITIYLEKIESLHPGIVCSVMEVKGNKLFHIAAPSLPQAVKDEVEGVKIGENKGCSAMAAFRKQKIVANNLVYNPGFTGKKEMAATFGLKSCWSYPLIDSQGAAIGVFAVFNKETNAVAGLQEKTIERSVRLLQIIVESFKREQSLRISNERFEYATEATSDVIWDWDLETNEVWFSRNMETVFGYKDAGEYNDINFYRGCIHADDQNAVAIYAEEIRKSSISKWEQFYRFKKANGEYAFVRDEFKIIRDDNGLGLRMVGAMSDVTRQKQEEQRLKLFESVVTRTKDVIIISEAEPLGEPGPRVLFVNEAFTTTTGYLAEEIIGKTPRILQGAKTNPEELKRMGQLLRSWQPVEATVVNYKKNGEKFWVNLSITPVADDNGWYTHWVSIQRDVTAKKNEELQNDLIAEISQIFNTKKTLKECLTESMALLCSRGDFGLTEFWMIDSEKNKVNFITSAINSAALKTFSENAGNYAGVVKGEGFVGTAWETRQLQYWNYNDGGLMPKRIAETIDAGIKRAYALPVVYDLKAIAVLVLLMDKDELPDMGLADNFTHFSEAFAPKIIRKQVEDELNQIFNLAPDILCISNSSGYFRKINPAMCTLLEYTEQELVTVPYNVYVHPDDKLKTESEIESVFDNRASAYFENRYITKSGKIKWLAWTSSHTTSEGLVYSVARDITEKKDLETLLHNATNLARIGGWELDLKNGIVLWSDMTREILEVDADLVSDFEAAAGFYEKGPDRDAINGLIERAVRFGIPGQTELQIITAKGNRKWVRSIVQAEMVNERVTRVYGSFQDIDDRKKMEMALEESLNEKKEILESIGDAFYTVDKNWIVTYWNNMAAAVTGVPANQVLGNNIWEVFPRAVNTESYKKYHFALQTNQMQDFEQHYPHNGKSFSLSVYPSKHGLAVYFKEITDRKAAEQKLMELNENLQKQAKELEISNAELEQFAYVASHDLQEPLRMVTSFLAQIEKKYNDLLDDKGKQYIHFAVDGAKRMRQIILDLLEFSRVGSMVEEKETVYLDRVIKEIEALYRRKIEEAKAIINYGNLPAVKSYKTPVREIFQNLISNALKYQIKGVKPVINIGCQETEGYWLISVQDNGIGIDPVYFDRIFIIFQRLHGKEEYSGTGMGLAITKKIVESLGGKIWVESERDKGSTFYFTILKNSK